MSKEEHRVEVDGGRYTFVVAADDHRVCILRDGAPWHGPQVEASGALSSIMCELDAARVVVQAARRVVELHSEGIAPIGGLRDALELHERLCDDRLPPSPWVSRPGCV